MLLFNWTQIDWVKWMPVEVGILFLLILLIRIIRRFSRWGPTKVSHVNIFRYPSPFFNIRCYCKIPPQSPLFHAKNIRDYNLSDRINHKKLILFPPLFSNIEKYNHIATALALLDYDIFIFDPRTISSYLKNSLLFKDKMIEFINNTHISKYILFDYSIPMMLDVLNQIHQSDSTTLLNEIEMKIILIRPILNWSDIKSVLFLIPFSFNWMARLKLNLLLRAKNVKPIILENKQFATIRNKNYDKFFVIHSKNTWLSKLGKNNWNQWEKQDIKIPSSQIVHFSKGSWNFYRNETVVLGYIAQFLNFP